MNTKICTKCKELKMLNLFKMDNRNVSGRAAQCKLCSSRAAIIYHQTSPKWQQYAKKYAQENYEKEIRRKLKYKKENPDKHRQYQNRRAKQIILATPKWLNEEQRAEIEETYALAKELSWLSNEPLVVDHVVPFLGKNVHGLHVPWNLQIIPARQNCSKGNRVEGWVNLSGL